MKKKKTSPEQSVKLVDPILPLPYNPRPVVLRQDEKILHQTSQVTLEMPYAAFWMLWEQAERLAERNYQKYLDGPLNHVAQASLEAVYACRNAASMTPLERFSEKQAQKLRAKSAPKIVKRGRPATPKCPKCKSKDLRKIKKDDVKLFRCQSCKKRFPR